MGASTRGEIIRANRNLKGWSQDELANKVGVSRNMVSLWETDASELSIRNAKALAQALDINIVEIILGEDSYDDRSEDESSGDPGLFLCNKKPEIIADRQHAFTSGASATQVKPEIITGRLREPATQAVKA